MKALRSIELSLYSIRCHNCATMRVWLLVLILVGTQIFGQVSSEQDVYRAGPGVLPPKLIQKRERVYSEEALRARIQGTVVLDLTVNGRGEPTDISVVSPLGFGLDERARKAIEQWRFQPGTKDGKPVKIRAMVEVNFKLPGFSYDANAERRRTAFNLAVRDLQKHDEKITARSVESIQRLANENFPPAMYTKAIFMREGKLLPQDNAESARLLTNAAAKHHGPSMYELGVMYIEGRDLPVDTEKGMKSIRDAATLGSKQAAFYLGAHYEAGEGLPRDSDKARHYFRLCAAAREAQCQYRLGRLLLADRGRQDDNYVQGLAWLQLASEQGSAPARALLAEEIPKANEGQVGWMEKLKPQLTGKP
jgi:TonB family protein